jgi:RNA-binding protein YhbY
MASLSRRRTKREKTSLGKPAIWIGKNGATEQLMKEISKYLEALKKLMKLLIKQPKQRVP